MTTHKHALAEATEPILSEARERAHSVRADIWEQVVRRAQGSPTAAGKEMGFTAQRAYALTRRYGLLDLAEQLRADSGQRAGGRPRVSPTKKS